MSRPHVGVLLEDGQVTVATLLGPDRFRLAMLHHDDTLPARLATALGTPSGRRPRLRAALDRQRVVVKTLELPPTSISRRRSMLAFELERHLPFPAEHAEFDWTPAPIAWRAKTALLGVLIAAAPARLVEDTLRLLAAAGVRPRSVTVACHDLPALLRRRPVVRRAVWIHRHRGRADILLLSRGVLRLSRNVPAESEAELAVEFARSLTLLDWKDCDAVWVSGDMNVALRAAVKAGEVRARVSRPPLTPAAERMLAHLEPERRGAGLLALAVAAGHRRPALDLLPLAMRPRRIAQAHALAAGLAALALTAGAGLLAAQDHMQNRYLRLVTEEIRRLDPEVKSVERLGGELQQQRKLLTTLRSAEAGGLRPLPVLKDLTEIIPRDAWLQSLTMDRQGVELTGQAEAASPLIPLLEGSPWLERVEFTAPVTRVLTREQFRLRAGWETADRRSGGGAPEGAASMAALGRRERALIGLGLAVVLAVGGYLQLIEPWRARQRETAELIPTREATLEKRRLLVAQRERLRADLDVLTQKVTEASAGLLPGPTAPLAASKLQRLMKEMATGARVDIRSERVLAPLDLSGVLEIPIELTVAGDIRQIVALLARLERAPHLLTVKDIVFRVAAPGQPRELLTTLVVAGYLRPGQGAARLEPTGEREST